MSIGENIKRVRLANDMTQEEFGRIAGVSPMAVSQWENDRAVPRMGAIQRISDFLNVSMSEIIDEEPPTAPRHSSIPRIEYSYTKVPVIGAVAAGEPREAFEIVEGEITVPEVFQATHPRMRSLRISGESMNKLFGHGSYVLYDPDLEVRSGDVAVVYVNGDDATVKRVFFAGDTVVLHPESTVDEYKDRAIGVKDPDAPAVTFAGRVFWRSDGDKEMRF